eukprot:m.156678 g.156678  ORF g.156678 m.156678 type:complete len:75 (-) comp16444_c0_seq1:2505-2729(-)
MTSQLGFARISCVPIAIFGLRTLDLADRYQFCVQLDSQFMAFMLCSPLNSLVSSAFSSPFEGCFVTFRPWQPPC